jgi:hypothetical protein
MVGSAGHGPPSGRPHLDFIARYLIDNEKLTIVAPPEDTGPSQDAGPEQDLDGSPQSDTEGSQGKLEKVL